MKIQKKVFVIGLLFVTAGIFMALVSGNPSRALQYIMTAVSFLAGVCGLLIVRNRSENVMRSTYYLLVGVSLIGFSIVLALLGAQLMMFINLVGFFLLLMGIVEFVYILQILNYEKTVPWKVLLHKSLLSGASSIGSVWILTMAGIDVSVALLFLGVLLAFVGLNFLQLSRIPNAT
jgi:hypothetical protein